MPDFTQPSPGQVAFALGLLEPWRRVVRPVFVGLERIPDERPLLFVGNHTLYGVLDIPFMFGELYRSRGIFLRGLGDHLHFKVPLWRELLHHFGAVDGTREHCAALMTAGEAVLVFPGGGREVAKRKGERYKLVWKDRIGFARLAIAHACTIIPFAAVGVEHAYDILLDADEIMASKLGGVLRRLGVRSDVVMPIARGLGPTLLPRPERLYFHFGDPIRTGEYGRDSGDAPARLLRDRVQAEVQAGIELLLDLRERDPDRSPLPWRRGRTG